MLATGLAALPVGPLVGCYLWLDRYEPEPKWLLAFGLLWGGFVATGAALLLQGLGGWFVGFTDDQSLAIVAPITEEASKGLFLFLLLWWRRAELDGILDGIVYAGMVGIGFAFIENILYLAAAYNGTDGMGPGGTGAITGVFVIRCLFSPFAHPLFTTFIGIGVGLAVSSPRRSVRILAPFVRLPARRRRTRRLECIHPVGFHGLRKCVLRVDGPRVRRPHVPGDLVASVGAQDAHRRPVRRLPARPDPGHRHRLAGRSQGPAGRARVRSRVRREAGRARR